MDENEIEITTEHKPNGILLSTIYRGQYYKHLYILVEEGDDIEEHFRDYVRSEDAKIIRGV